VIAAAPAVGGVARALRGAAQFAIGSVLGRSGRLKSAQSASPRSLFFVRGKCNDCNANGLSSRDRPGWRSFHVSAVAKVILSEPPTKTSRSDRRRPINSRALPRRSDTTSACARPTPHRYSRGRGCRAAFTAKPARFVAPSSSSVIPQSLASQSLLGRGQSRSHCFRVVGW
jgi:hypothetical protein